MHSHHDRLPDIDLAFLLNPYEEISSPLHNSRHGCHTCTRFPYLLLESSSSNEQLKQYKAWVSNERWNELKKIAETAMKERKVFMIKGGGYPAIRRALLERGWIEKYESHKVSRY